MRLVKIGLASVNPTVGAVDSNLDAVLGAADRMAEEDVTIAAYPEQVLGGYAPEDLVQWAGFVDAQWHALKTFAKRTKKQPQVHVVGLVVGLGGQLYNTAAVVHAGRVLGLVPKERLPTYEVFYEARTMSRGGPGLGEPLDGVPLGDHIFTFDFGTLAVEVCEDAWTPTGPMRRRCLSGAEVVVNLSASPYRVGVVGTRREMLATRSADNEATLAYACRVGGQDGLVYDGGGYVFQNGRLVLDAPRFEAGVWTTVVDLDRTRRRRRENTTWRVEQAAFRRDGALVAAIASDAKTANRAGLRYPGSGNGGFFLPPADPVSRSPREETLDDVFEALAMGVADFYQKTGAFDAMGVAVSGGRDSALTLLVAWRALQRLRDAGTDARLQAFWMPSRFSRSETEDAARALCADLEVPVETVDIDEAFERETQAAQAMLGGQEPDEVTRQNVQARIRGARMWNWANSAKGLFLQTGDMSEKAVGYTTIGGDLEGGLSVIANLPKTVVNASLERLHERFGFEGIRKTLATYAGPELAEAQQAEEELMPFEVLDACLQLYAEEKMTPDEVGRALADLFPDGDPKEMAGHARRFAAMFSRSIYKWVQSPLSLHVGRIDLERERALQLPVVQRNEWW